jgi:hypothetical protein
VNGPVPLLVVTVSVTEPKQALETAKADTCGNGLMVISIEADVAFVHPSEFAILRYHVFVVNAGGEKFWLVPFVVIFVKVTLSGLFCHW